VQVRRLGDNGRVDPRSLRYCLQNVLDNELAAPFSSSEMAMLRGTRKHMTAEYGEPIVR